VVERGDAPVAFFCGVKHVYDTLVLKRAIDSIRSGSRRRSGRVVVLERGLEVLAGGTDLASIVARLGVGLEESPGVGEISVGAQDLVAVKVGDAGVAHLLGGGGGDGALAVATRRLYRGRRLIRTIITIVHIHIRMQR